MFEIKPSIEEIKEHIKIKRRVLLGRLSALLPAQWVLDQQEGQRSFSETITLKMKLLSHKSFFYLLCALCGA